MTSSLLSFLKSSRNHAWEDQHGVLKDIVQQKKMDWHERAELNGTNIWHEATAYHCPELIDWLLHQAKMPLRLIEEDYALGILQSQHFEAIIELNVPWTFSSSQKEDTSFIFSTLVDNDPKQMRPQKLKWLLEHQFNPNASRYFSGSDWTPLIFAGQNEVLEQVQLLLDFGADPLFVADSLTEKTVIDKLKGWLGEDAPTVKLIKAKLADNERQVLQHTTQDLHKNLNKPSFKRI